MSKRYHLATQRFLKCACCRGLNKCQHHFEVNLRYVMLCLYDGCTTIISVYLLIIGHNTTPSLHPPPPTPDQTRLDRGLSEAYLGLILARESMAWARVGLEAVTVWPPRTSDTASCRRSFPSRPWCLRGVILYAFL